MNFTREVQDLLNISEEDLRELAKETKEFNADIGDTLAIL